PVGSDGQREPHASAQAGHEPVRTTHQVGQHTRRGPVDAAASGSAGARRRVEPVIWPRPAPQRPRGQPSGPIRARDRQGAQRDDRLAAGPARRLPVPVRPLPGSPAGRSGPFRVPGTDAWRWRPMMRHGSRVGETAELIRLLSAVESMRHPTGRGALADELNLAYAHDLFRNRYVVNRADLSVPEIVTALMTMTDWPRILRHEVCGIRTDLFPEPEQAVAELLAFLARLLRRTGAGTVANDLENSVRR